MTSSLAALTSAAAEVASSLRSISFSLVCGQRRQAGQGY
jgi:hypothetical protein